MTAPRTARTRPWWLAPATDDRTVTIGAYLLRRGYSPATVLAWLAQQ